MALHKGTKQMTNARSNDSYRANKLSNNHKQGWARRQEATQRNLEAGWARDYQIDLALEDAERALTAAKVAMATTHPLFDGLQIQTIEQVIEAEAGYQILVDEDRARKDRKNELARKRRAAAKAAAQLVEA